MRTRSNASRSSSGRLSIASSMRRPSGERPESLLAGAQLHDHRLIIQASGLVFQLPAHVLASQGEELPDGSGTGLAQGLEQPLRHCAEQLVRLEVEWRVRQPWVVVV